MRRKSGLNQIVNHNWREETRILPPLSEYLPFLYFPRLTNHLTASYVDEHPHRRFNCETLSIYKEVNKELFVQSFIYRSTHVPFVTWLFGLFWFGLVGFLAGRSYTRARNATTPPAHKSYCDKEFLSGFSPFTFLQLRPRDCIRPQSVFNARES